MNLAQSLLTGLRQHGAREVFGIPGDFVLGLFREIEASGILPLYTLSHESGTAYAADGAARIGMRPGVVVTTYGAGALNLVGAVAGAYAEKSPLVVISGAPGTNERSSGLLLHHQVKSLDSQRRIFEEITCAQAVLDDAGTAPAEIARVLRRCIDDSRPVYIEVPRDLATAPCGEVVPLPSPRADPQALSAVADDILAAIRAAKQPAILLCVEVRRFGIEERVAELVRRLRVPAYTTFMGQGVLARYPSRVQGSYRGAAGDPQVAARVDGSDALLMLGVILSDTNFGVSAPRMDMRRPIRVADGEVRIHGRVLSRLPIGEVVEALIARLPPVADPPSPPRSRAMDFVADEAPLSPDDVAPAVNAAATRHGLPAIVSDVGDCLWASFDMPTGALLAPGFFAGMGFAVPAGIGVQIASGLRPLILVGNGAFEMTGWELGNCKRYGLDPVVLVFNNRSWEMLRVFEPGAGFLDRGDWNFAAMASGMGGEGRRVQTRAELAAALDAAFARRGAFQLIEMVLPVGALSPELQRFVARIRPADPGAVTSRTPAPPAPR